jgi:Tfp pilus assembly protein PilO
MVASAPELKTWSRVVALAGVGVLSLLSGIGYWIAIRPLTLQIDDQQRQIEQKLKFAECSQVLHERSQLVSIKHAELQDALQAQLARIPSYAEVDEFLSWSSNHARDLGMELRDFRPAGTSTYGELEGMNIRLHAAGRYVSICEFLQALSAGPRMTRVVGIEISPLDLQSRTFQFTLQIIVFYQPSKAVETPKVEGSHV